MLTVKPGVHFFVYLRPPNAITIQRNLPFFNSRPSSAEIFDVDMMTDVGDGCWWQMEGDGSGIRRLSMTILGVGDNLAFWTRTSALVRGSLVATDLVV